MESERELSGSEVFRLAATALLLFAVVFGLAVGNTWASMMEVVKISAITLPAAGYVFKLAERLGW